MLHSRRSVHTATSRPSSSHYSGLRPFCWSNPEVVSDVQPLDESLDLQARLLEDAESLGDSAESQDPPGGGCSC